MKVTIKKAFWIIPALVLIFTSCPNPSGGNGGDNGETTPTININGMTVDGLKSAIETELTENDNVTITGTMSDITDPLDLDIPVNKTVTWKADYTGLGLNDIDNQIALTGAGNFIIADGGKIESSAERIIDLRNDFTGTFIVETGGSIIKGVLSLGIARCIDVLKGGTVIVRGGTIEATSFAILTVINSNARVFIESGNISSSSGNTTMIINGNSTLSISSGTITNASTGAAVAVNSDAKVYVTGSPVIGNDKIERFASADEGYYTGDHLAKFNTTAGNIFTVNENLSALTEPPDWAVLE